MKSSQKVRLTVEDDAEVVTTASGCAGHSSGRFDCSPSSGSLSSDIIE